MQACEAYYDNGRFVPLGFGELPKGTRAIITLLNEAPSDVTDQLKAFDELWAGIEAAANEEMPPIERLNFTREVSP